MKNDPYVGPRPYSRQDRNNFYGRNREGRELLSLILSEREVLFYAPSGAGKSSLLNARVLPALEDEGFAVLPVVRVGSELPPGIDPAAVPNVFAFSVLMGLAGEGVAPQELLPHTLRTFLEQGRGGGGGTDAVPSTGDAGGGGTDTAPSTGVADGGGADAVPSTGVADGRGTDAVLSTGVADDRGADAVPSTGVADGPPLLILDQFEELFTTHRDRWQEATGFFQQLREALDAIPRLGVVVTMREDFVAQLDPYAVTLPRRLQARFRIECLGPRGALEAVVQPALNAGCPFTEGVAERLVDDLRRVQVQRPDGLSGEPVLGPTVEPVQLQVVCRRLWENLPEQPDRMIQWEDVEQYGNIDRALTGFYEESLQQAVQASGAAEHIVRHWFGEQLITPMKTRGLVLRGETETAGLPNRAVDALEEAHLVRADVRAGVRWYELCHDRMVEPILASNRAWEAARETPLRQAARHWQASQDDGLLYRGQALQKALDWAKDHPAEVEPEEQSFLEASQEAETARRKQRVLRVVATVAAGAVIILISVFALLANRARALARSKELAALSANLHGSNGELSIVVARMGLDGAYSPEAEIALRQAVQDFFPTTVLSRTGSAALGVAFSPDGQSVAVGLRSGATLLWDTKTHQLSGRLRAQEKSAGGAWGVAFSPDGQTLAVGYSDGMIRLWDVDTGAEQGSLSGHSRIVYSLAYSPDGRYLVSGGRDGTVRLWDLQSSEPSTSTVILTKFTLGVEVVSVSVLGTPTGFLVAAGGNPDPVVQVWEVGHSITDTLVMTQTYGLAGHTGGVKGVALSPDGRWLASGSYDRTVRLWSLSQGRATMTLIGHTRGNLSVAFSPDGRYLASGGDDTAVRLWNVGNRYPYAVGVLAGEASAINGLAFSPDGRFVASVSTEGVVRLWDSQPPQRAMLEPVFFPYGFYAVNIAVNPDGRFLAAGGTDRVTHIFSQETGREVAQLRPEGGGKVWGVEYSPQGDYLVTCDEDKDAYLWNAPEGAGLTATEIITQPLWVMEGHEGIVNAAAFSPDGRYVVTVSDDGTARIWDPQHQEAGPVLEGHKDMVLDVDWSPDGRLIATASADDTVWLWRVWESGDLLSASAVLSITAHTDDVYGVAFSPDGKYLASGSWDRTVLLWPLKQDREGNVRLRQPTVLPNLARVYALDYSPDGKYLAVGTRAGQVRLWDLSLRTPQVVAVLASHTDRVTSVAFSPDGKYVVSAAVDGTLRRYLARFQDALDLSREYVPRDDLTREEYVSIFGRAP